MMATNKVVNPERVSSEQEEEIVRGTLRAIASGKMGGKRMPRRVMRLFARAALEYLPLGPMKKRA